MFTVCLRYWHIFGKGDIEKRGYNLKRRDKTPKNLCYHIITKLIHNWQLPESS